MKKQGVTILFILLAFCSNAFTQCCSGGVPISGSLGLTSTEGKTIHLSLTYDYNALNDLFESDRSLDDKSRKRITHSGLLEVNYGLTGRITLTGMVSAVRQERIIHTRTGERNFDATNGPGDAILMIKYRLITPDMLPGYSLTIGSGPKIPLGRTNLKNNLGLALPADMQPGSGAWDMMFWSVFEKYTFLIENFSLSAAITYRYTGTNRNYFEGQSYRFGNELAFNLQSKYRFLIKSMIFDGNLTLRYRSMQEDKFNGNDFPNSGGEFISLMPAINYNFSPDLSIRIGSYIPLYRKVEGTQLSPGYKFIASLSYILSSRDDHEILDKSKTFKITE